MEKTSTWSIVIVRDTNTGADRRLFISADFFLSHIDRLKQAMDCKYDRLSPVRISHVMCHWLKMTVTESMWIQQALKTTCHWWFWFTSSIRYWYRKKNKRWNALLCQWEWINTKPGHSMVSAIGCWHQRTLWVWYVSHSVVSLELGGRTQGWCPLVCPTDCPQPSIDFLYLGQNRHRQSKQEHFREKGHHSLSIMASALWWCYIPPFFTICL